MKKNLVDEVLAKIVLDSLGPCASCLASNLSKLQSVNKASPSLHCKCQQGSETSCDCCAEDRPL